MKKPHTKAEKDLLNLVLLADIAKEFERRGMKKKAKECWAAFDAAPVEEIVARAGTLAKQKPYACSNCGRRYKTVEATLIHKLAVPAEASLRQSATPLYDFYLYVALHPEIDDRLAGGNAEVSDGGHK